MQTFKDTMGNIEKDKQGSQNQQLLLQEFLQQLLMKKCGRNPQKREKTRPEKLKVSISSENIGKGKLNCKDV